MTNFKGDDREIAATLKRIQESMLRLVVANRELKKATNYKKGK